MSPSDKALLDMYAARKDAEVFGQIVRRYAGMVYGSCLRVTGNAHDAEDAAQECFLELARHADSISASLPGWLHATATNHALMAARKNATRERHESQIAPRGNTEAAWDDIAPLVDRALEQLPEAERLPLVLHFLQGKTQEEVAAELNVSQPTVSRRIEKGIELLRDRLKKAGIIVPVAVVAALLGQNTAMAAPAALTAALGKMALAGVGAGTSTGTAASATTAASAIWGGMSAMKIAIVAAATAAILTVAGVVVVRQKQPALPVQAAHPTRLVEQAPAPSAPPALPVAPPVAPKETMFAKGTVVDEDGIPVADATVYAAKLGKGGIEVEFETRSDAVGRFTFHGLSRYGDGTLFYLFYAHKPGLAWGSDFLNIGDVHFIGDLRAPAVQHPLPAGVSDIEIPLAKAGPLAGRVLTKSGLPVQGAAVIPYSDTRNSLGGLNNLPFLRATTDAQGQFRLEDLPLGRKYDLAVEAPGFALMGYGTDDEHRLPQFTVGDTMVEIRPALEARVTGRVVYEKDGTPVAGAIVRGEDTQLYSTTGADGSFTLNGLVAGRNRLSFYSKEIAQLLRPPVMVELQEGRTLDGVVLKVLDSVPVAAPVLDEAAGKMPDSVLVTARVLDKATGMPVEAGEVSVEESDADGKDWSRQFARGALTLNLAPMACCYQLHVSARGYQGRALEILVTDQSAMTLPDIRLEPQSASQPAPAPVATWRLLVVDEAGIPLPEATLRNTDGDVLLGITGPDGRVQIQIPREIDEDGDPDLVSVLIREPVSKLVTIFRPAPDGTPPDEVKVVLRKPGTITGLVKDRLGKPVANARVHGWVGRWGTTDQAGRYAIRDVPAVKGVPLYVEARGYGRWGGVEAGEVNPGEAVSAPDIVLAPADQIITGQVTDAEGKPAAFVHVSADGQSTNSTSSTTDAEGRFTLKEIVLERVRLTVQPKGFAPFRMQLPAGAFKDVKVQLDR